MSRLVFVNRFFYPDNSATSQMLSHVCFTLANKGYRVSVVASQQHYSSDWESQPLKRTETIRGVDIIRLPAIGLGRDSQFGRLIDYLVFLVQAACFMLFRLRRGELVIAKTDPPMLGVFLWPFIRIRRARLVNWFQDLFPEVLIHVTSRDVGGWSSRLLSWLRDWSCRHALLNVTLSDAMAKYLEGRGIPKDKITVIPNFALDSLQSVERRDNVVRKELALTDAFVVGYSGNLGRAHDWRTMLGAAKLLSTHNDFRFLFFGGGVGMDALRSEAQRLSLANTEFCPYQPTELLSQSLSAIDVHLVSLQPGLSSHIFPSKIYGIMAVRRPIIFIGSREDAVGRYLKATRCGLVVDIGDANGLRDAIMQIKTNEKLYSEFANNGFREYQERYTLDRVSMQWGKSLDALQKGK